MTKIYVTIPERIAPAVEANARKSEYAASSFLLDWLASADAWSANSRAKINWVERNI